MPDTKSCDRREVTLVLSSGAALGLAHIGSIEMIERCFEIKAIVGTSMGAMVGGLYAAGMKPKEIVEMVEDLSPIDYIGMLRIGLPGKAFLETTWLEKYFRNQIGDIRIEDLNIPFAAVAFDVLNQKTVLIEKGPLASAMTASGCVPFLFEPFKTGNHALFDGAVEHPLPLAFAKRFSKYRPIIAVSCLPEIKKQPEQIEITKFDRKIDFDENYMHTSVKLQSYTQAAQALSSVLYHKPFLYINNHANKVREWELDKVESFYEIGRQAAQKAIDEKEQNQNFFDMLRGKFEEFLVMHFE